MSTLRPLYVVAVLLAVAAGALVRAQDDYTAAATDYAADEGAYEDDEGGAEGGEYEAEGELAFDDAFDDDAAANVGVPQPLTLHDDNYAPDADGEHAYEESAGEYEYEDEGQYEYEYEGEGEGGGEYEGDNEGAESEYEHDYEHYHHDDNEPATDDYHHDDDVHATDDYHHDAGEPATDDYHHDDDVRATDDAQHADGNEQQSEPGGFHTLPPPSAPPTVRAAALPPAPLSLANAGAAAAKSTAAAWAAAAAASGAAPTLAELDAELRAADTDVIGDSVALAPFDAPYSAAKLLEAGPLVSIIVSTYNSGPFTLRVLDRIFAQSYPHVEVIIVDDSSLCLTPDHFALSVANRADLDKIRYKCLTDGRLPEGAKRNVALREARGELVLLWDEADHFTHTRVEEQVRALVAADADLVLLRLSHVLDVHDDPLVLYNVRERAESVVFDTLLFRRALADAATLGVAFDEKSNSDDTRSKLVHDALVAGARVHTMHMPWVFLMEHDVFAQLSLARDDAVPLAEFPLFWYQSSNPDTFINQLLLHLARTGDGGTVAAAASGTADDDELRAALSPPTGDDGDGDGDVHNAAPAIAAVSAERRLAALRMAQRLADEIGAAGDRALDATGGDGVPHWRKR